MQTARVTIFKPIFCALQELGGYVSHAMKACPRPRDAGVLTVRVHRCAGGAVDVRLCAAHTAASMGIGHYSSDGQACEQSVRMLRHTPNEAAACTFEASAAWPAQREI